MRAPRAGEHGGVALLTLCGGLVMLMAAAFVLRAVTEIGVAAARARTAADAAALAAVSTPPSPGCDLARRLAEVNGAALTSCEAPGLGAAVVEVAVPPRSPHIRRLIGELPARAAAILDQPPIRPSPSP